MKSICVLGVAFSLLFTAACNRSSRVTPVASQPAKPVATLSSDELIAEYQKNSLGADQKFKGQLVEVSGKVGKIGKGLMGAPFVSLGTASEDDQFGVTCYLTPAAADEAAKLQPGAAVKVRGTCMGQLGGIALRLQDCDFVK